MKRRPPLERARKRLRQSLRSLGINEAEIGVLFTGDRAIRSLNRKYRGINKATDVLSFSMREGLFPHVQPQLLGDIVISVPAASRQARKSGVSLAEEIDRLAVHGLLHLAGYDHEKGEKEARRMSRKENNLLKHCP